MSNSNESCDSCIKPYTRSRKKRKYCTNCGRKLTLDSEDTSQQERPPNLLSRSAERIYENFQNVSVNGEARSAARHLQAAYNPNDSEVLELSNRLRRSLVFEPQEVAANPANENIYEVPRDAGEERAEEINEAREDLNDTISLTGSEDSHYIEIPVNEDELPYSYKFSRGQIFAHFVCAKINYFRADLFSRTFKTINFCADKISRTSFFSTSKTLKFTPKSAVLWRKLFHIVLKIFARINFRAPVQNLRKFGTYFRAISRKIGLCAKMRENLYARKLVRIS